MKTLLLPLSCLSLLSLAAPAMAQDVGRVVSSMPVLSQVSVPRQVCANDVVQVQNTTPASKSGAGAVMGGLAGGAIGNAVGNGSGRALMTAIGIFGGAVLGDKIEGGSPAQTVVTQQNVQRCNTQNFIETRTTAYNVVYEYAGKQYSVQMPSDPGPTIQLQVAPAGAQLSPPTSQIAPPVYAPAPVQQQPIYVPAPISQGPTVIESGVVYQAYSPQIVTQYVQPVVVSPYYYRQSAPVFSSSLVIQSGGYRHYGPNPGYYYGPRWR